MRRTVLRRRTPLRRTRWLPERPTRRHPTPKGPDSLTVEKVMLRAVRNQQVCCEVCAEPVGASRGLDWSVHHRRGRDGRADRNAVQNLLLVCGADNQSGSGCHGRIHSRRSEAQPAGWWLSRIVGEDPLAVPVLIDRGSRWVYLTASGEYADSPSGGGVR